MGRDVKLSNTVICIMWTSMCVLSSSNRFMPNHFVPVVKKPQRAVQNTPIYVEDSPLCENKMSHCNTNSGMKNDLSNITAQTDTIDDADRRKDVTDTENISADVTNTDNADSRENISAYVMNMDNADSTDSDANPQNNEKQTNLTDCLLDSDDDDVEDANNPAKGVNEGSCFMETSKVVHLLISSETCFDQIPGGKKENVYFVINNENNQMKRKGKGKSSFSDDCGVWESKAGTSPISYYLSQENGDLKKKRPIFIRKSSVLFQKLR